MLKEKKNNLKKLHTMSLYSYSIIVIKYQYYGEEHVSSCQVLRMRLQGWCGHKRIGGGRFV